MPRTLGFFYRSRRTGGLYGVSEAEEGLLSAILRYSSWDKIIVWTDSHRTSDMGRTSADIRPSYRMIEDVSRAEVNAIHHVGLGPAAFSKVRINKPVPIYTSVYPALSYNHQVKEHIVEALSRKTNLDTNIYPSQCSRDVVKRIYEPLMKYGLDWNGELREVVIPIGVDTDTFSPIAEDKRAEIRQRDGIPLGVTVAIVVSRFSPSDKADILPLLRSIKYNNFAPSHEVLFVLSGGDRYSGAKRYIELLKQEVEVLGLFGKVIVLTINERERLIDLVRSADIFLSPSDSVQETFGITPLEAMSAGLPAIVSDWDGYRETILDGRTGYLVKTTLFNNEYLWKCADFNSDYRRQHLLIGQSVTVDTDDMVAKCHALASEPELLNSISISARSHVLENYSWHKIITSYEFLWEEKESAHFLTERDFPVSLDYLFIFQDYSTEIQRDDNVFELTPYGKAVYQGKYRLPILSDLAYFISADLIHRVLECFIETPESVLGLEVQLRDCEKDSVRFCIGWMAKNHIIKGVDSRDSK